MKRRSLIAEKGGWQRASRLLVAVLLLANAQPTWAGPAVLFNAPIGKAIPPASLMLHMLPMAPAPLSVPQPKGPSCTRNIQVAWSAAHGTVVRIARALAEGVGTAFLSLSIKGGGSNSYVGDPGPGISFGAGWTSNVNPYIARQADGTFLYYDGNGGEQLFIPLGSLEQPINGNSDLFAKPVGDYSTLSLGQGVVSGDALT